MTEYKPTSFFVLTLLLLCSSLCCCLSYNKYIFISKSTAPDGLAFTSTAPDGLDLIPTPTRLTPISLFSYLNNKGIGSAPGQANIDGSGFSYPANQLPQAGQRTLTGIRYQFPASAPLANDNVVALGQTIKLPPGNYQQAFLLATETWGPGLESHSSMSNTIIVHYTDGSTSSGSLSVPDWEIGPPGVVNTTYRYSSTSTTPDQVHIYALQTEIDPTKIASSLTLPSTAQPSPQQASLHVFALTLQNAT
jgi:alpha-L-fucosidase